MCFSCPQTSPPTGDIPITLALCDIFDNFVKLAIKASSLAAMIWTGCRLAAAQQENNSQLRADNMYNPLHMRRERNRLKKLLERRRNAIEGDREIRRMHTKQPLPQHEILHDADDEEDRKKELKVPALFRRTSSRRSDRSTSSKYRLSSLNSLCVDFGGRTSSHGVPFICGTSCCGPWVWTVIFILCTVCFIIQTYWTMKEYFQYRTIIEMQLKFEAAPFPAATVCNLNPFKYSQLIQYDELREGFEHWDRVMNARAMTEALKKDANELRKIELEERDREKRSAEKEWIFPIDKHELQKGAVYSPVFVRCTCINQEQCVPNRNPLETNASVCMCFEDITRGLIWPCYPSNAWTVKKCTKCSISNTCPDPDRPNATKPIGEEQPCLCQGISHHCMVHDPKEDIRWWNPNNYTVYPVTEPPKPTDTDEAFGLGELNDAGAITTKTKENIIFLVAALPRESRKNLSYTLRDFVLRCSFNSQDCDMVRDFELHMDPEYGNCYTFNFNDSVKLKNSRAGPMYGLRLLLDVHQDDYLPTTEAAGVRLVIHEQHQEPFPDIAGYSAPTGFISSFGLKTKVLQRLDHPWGSCSDYFRPEPYIYQEHYSLEGCHRNCFQMNVIDKCSCGDPRFPLPDQDIRYCEAKSISDRNCLANMMDEKSGYHHIKEKCICRQPCTENVFETAYSAASWPSANFRLGTACPAVPSIINDSKACTEYYRENTAYIEIYYEQLNFESLKETEGYTMVNLFSDFGGNIGLWIGFSVITIFEYGELLIEVLAYFFYVKPRRKIREIKEKKVLKEEHKFRLKV